MERARALSKRLSRMTGFRYTAFCIAGILGFIANMAALVVTCVPKARRLLSEPCGTVLFTKYAFLKIRLSENDNLPREGRIKEGVSSEL